MILHTVETSSVFVVVSIWVMYTVSLYVFVTVEASREVFCVMNSVLLKNSVVVTKFEVNSYCMAAIYTKGTYTAPEPRFLL